MTAQPELPTGAPDDDHVLDDQRCDGAALAGPHVAVDGVEDQLAARRVQGDQVGVERVQVDPAVAHGDTAVDVAAAQRDVVRRGVLVAPELLTGHGVDGPELAVRAGDVHDAFHDQRGGLERVGRRAGRQADRAGLEHPRGDQLLDGLLVDLVERRVALSVVGAVVGEPVLRLRPGILDALEVDVAGGRGLALGGAECLVRDGLAGVHIVGHGVFLSYGRVCGGRSILAESGTSPPNTSAPVRPRPSSFPVVEP